MLSLNAVRDQLQTLGFMAPGTVLVGFPCELRVAAGQGVLVLEEIQGASGKCLLTKDFLCGCHIAPGTKLG